MIFFFINWLCALWFHVELAYVEISSDKTTIVNQPVILCNFLLVYASFAVDNSPISPYLLEHLRREMMKTMEIICVFFYLLGPQEARKSFVKYFFVCV